MKESAVKHAARIFCKSSWLEYRMIPRCVLKNRKDKKYIPVTTNPSTAKFLNPLDEISKLNLSMPARTKEV
jgi:hypothetical protein